MEKKSPRAQRRFYIYAATFAVLYIVLANIYGNRRDRAEWMDFNDANIHGIVTESSSSRGASAFKVDNSATTFVFMPIVRRLDFPEVAHIGDSIVKAARSDTLYVKRQGMATYWFAFKKDL